MGNRRGYEELGGRKQTNRPQNSNHPRQFRHNLESTRGGLRAASFFVVQGVSSMDSLSNIWKHPKTSVAGLLIAVVTIAGVLSQQGISLGNAGSGTVVSLLGALATALLGLLSKDPAGGAPTAGSTAKMGVWMLILLLQWPLLTGCSAAGAAQDIVNWTPTLQSAVATVDSTAALLDPVDAPIFVAATLGFDAASNLLVAQAKAFLANPKAEVLQQLQMAIVTLQQQVNASLLQAARIHNPASQQHALNAINAVGTVVNAILGIVQSVSSKQALARMASQSNLKLSEVLPYLDQDQAAEMLAAHYGEPVKLAQMQVARGIDSATRAGF
jgi:hypothetical protein